MSISSALQTGVSGLSANSVAVTRISENIANANTNGYKRQFADMVTTTSGMGGNSSSGVTAVNESDIRTSGTMTQTSSPTDLAINGGGFFVVSPIPNDPVQADYRLTRAGSFTPDKDGNLVNSAGLYLAGYQLNANGSLGAVNRGSFAGMQTVNVTNATLTPAASTAISVTGNLPSQESGVATPGAPFTSSATYYTALGASKTLNFSWQPTTTANKWTVTMSDDAGNPLGSVDVDYSGSGANAGGVLDYANATSLSGGAFSFDTATGMATLNLGTGGSAQTLTMALGAPGSSSGMTQFAGDFSPQTFTVDGTGSSALSRVEIDAAGNVSGVFDNGTRKALYQIPLAQVTNPDGLIAADGNAYMLSNKSGAFSTYTANSRPVGAITSNTLESSNVDIAQELTDLIRTQRAYSSNAKVVTTMDDMLNETTSMKR